MAERRMIAKTIVDSDAFLDMPLSSQALYFHLSVRADDDGFINNPKSIMRNVKCSDDDLKILAAKKFIIPFESGVVVIKHWKIHNYIRNDRYKETKYKGERAQLSLDENGAYTTKIVDSGIPTVYQLPTNCVPSVDKMDTQVRLGKVRLGKVRLEERESKRETATVSPAPPPNRSIDYEAIRGLYNKICTAFPRCMALSDARKKAIRARFLCGYTEDNFKTLFEKAEASSFLKGCNDRNWTANFDWLLKDANMAKVLDGNYDDRAGGCARQPARQKTFSELVAEAEAKGEL